MEIKNKFSFNDLGTTNMVYQYESYKYTVSTNVFIDTRNNHDMNIKMCQTKNTKLVAFGGFHRTPMFKLHFIEDTNK